MPSDKTELANKSRLTVSNPLDVVPDEIPFDVLSGPPISLAYAATRNPADVDSHMEQAIRTLAYELWERAGRPEGLDSSGASWADHFWFQAQNHLFNPSDRERTEYMVSTSLD